MWEFLSDSLIENKEINLYFELKKNGEWQITKASWHKAIRAIPSKNLMDWLRKATILETECSLWALGRKCHVDSEKSLPPLRACA